MADDGGKRSRWRGMLSKKDKDDTGGLVKETEKLQVADDVMDFLAPSIAKANSVSTRASPMKMPKLDVAAAQRFPGAHDIGQGGSPDSKNAAGTASNNFGNGLGLKKRRRRPNLQVSFAMTPPEIIGEGGDEAELPVMAIGKMKEQKPPGWDRLPHGSRDDSALGHGGLHGRGDNVIGPGGQFNGQHHPMAPEAPNSGLRRALTHGHVPVTPIQASAQPMQPPQPQQQYQQSDPFADGPDDFQPKPISRTATGWSDYSGEGQDGDAFQPKPLARTATGWSDVLEGNGPTATSHGTSAIKGADASAEFGIGRPSFSSDGQSSTYQTNSESPEKFRQYDRIPDRAPMLPEIELLAEESPLEFRKASVDATHWLAASPTDPNSFSAKLIHKMRVEEGRALHDYVRNSMSLGDGTAAALGLPADLDAKDDNDPQPAQPAGRVPMPNQPPTLAQPRPPLPNSFSHQTQASRPPPFPQSSFPPPAQPPQRQLLVADPRAQGPGGSPMPPAHMSLTPRDQSPASHHSNSTRPTPSPLAHNAPSATASNNYFPQQNPPQPPGHQQYVAYHAPPGPSTQQQPYSAAPPPQLPPPSQDIYHTARQPPAQQTDQFPLSTQTSQQAQRGLPKSLATRLSESVAPVPSSSQSSPRSRDSGGSLTSPAQSTLSNTSVTSTATATSGDAALDDFSERVQHMSGIFRLTAEVIQPASKYTAAQWLRCCLWWFLRGRAGLEALLQSRQRARSGPPPFQQGGQQLPPTHDGNERLCQAHVDLAKVVWLMNEIFPTLPVLQAYNQGNGVPLTAPATLAAARDAGNAEALQVLEALDAVNVSLKAVLTSCVKNGAMPPHASLIQGQDQSIWSQFPALPREVAQFVTANPTTGPLDIMPVADTARDFAFGRMFVNATVSTPNQRFEPGPCVLSIMRERNTWGLKVAICSQTETFNLIIQDEHERHKDQGWGPGWRDVQWDPQRPRMVVDLMGAPVTPPVGMAVHTPVGRLSALIEFTEADYMQLTNIWNYTRSVSTSMLPRRDERYAHEILAVALRFSEETHIGSPNHQRQTSFPTDRVKRCRVRVFEKFEVIDTESGRRKLQRGFRLLAVTSPKGRSLSATSMDIGHLRPVVCEMVDDTVTGQQLPALTLRNMGQNSLTSLLIVFNDPAERQNLLNLVTGVTQGGGERVACVVRLGSLIMEEASIAESYAHSHANPLRHTRWLDAMLITRDEEQMQSPDEAIMAERLRIVARGQGVGFTDRLTLAPGELKLRLPATGSSSLPSAALSILRPHAPAPCTTVTTISSQPDPSAAGPLTKLLELSARQPTAQNYHFPTLSELHKFEAALTGHAVLFDGLAAAFTISHRIALVPIHRLHGAHDVRIQLVRRQGDVGSVLLLAFFEGFALAEAMCFRLLSTNVFELVDGSDRRAGKKDGASSSGGGGGGEKEAGFGKFGVKLVDAKFSMPRLRREKDEGDKEGGGGGPLSGASAWRRHRRDKSRDSVDTGRESRTGDRDAPVDPSRVAERFVSLDMLEYPGEHDDIVIGFDEEDVRAAFVEALPATANVSRSITFKRRI